MEAPTAFATNLNMPEPCDFIDESLPVCSIIRPTLAKNAGPLAVVAFLTNQGLFTGQSEDFFEALNAYSKSRCAGSTSIGGRGKEGGGGLNKES
jgi:hypothetical protein